MPPVGFEPTISAGARPQTYALDRAATGTGGDCVYANEFPVAVEDIDVDNVRTTAQAVVGPYGGTNPMVPAFLKYLPSLNLPELHCRIILTHSCMSLKQHLTLMCSN